MKNEDEKTVDFASVRNDIGMSHYYIATGPTKIL